MNNQQIKKIINFVMIMTIILLGKIELVNAEPYEVTLNGIEYICESKGESFGTGKLKSQYPSAEVAKKVCTEQQRNYINAINEIYIFDDPTKCEFVETADLYDCNCHATTYGNCIKKNTNQTSTNNETYTFQIDFMDENGKVYSTEKCNSTSGKNECSIKTPNYKCSNGNEFNGWGTEAINGCSSGVPASKTLYFGSSGQLYSYFTYYPCCDSNTNSISNPTFTPSNTTVNNSTPIPSTPTVDDTTDDPTTDTNINPTTEPSINPTNESNNNDKIKVQEKSSSLTAFLIILCALIVCLVILILMYLKVNKDEESQIK